MINSAVMYFKAVLRDQERTEFKLGLSVSQYLKMIRS